MASNLEGFRSGTSRYIFRFSEIRAEGFFKTVRNSIMIRENETYAFIKAAEKVIRMTTPKESK